MYYLYHNHISFYVGYLGMNYNNVIGFLLFIIFISQFVSGLLLSCYYSDYYKMAFESIVYMMTDVNIGWFIRFLHIIGVSLFMLFILFHLMSGMWMSFKNMFLDSTINMMWASGLLLLAVSLVEGFLGYMLLWGQMSYWGITVMLNMLSLIPYFGLFLMELMWSSSYVIIYRMFMFHYLMGMLMGSLMLLHLKLINNGFNMIIGYYILFSMLFLINSFFFTTWL